MTEHVHLAVAFDGFGWHPEAWRRTADATAVTGGRYWAETTAVAERGLLDFVTFDDALTAQRRHRPDIESRWLTGCPDAVLVAARVAPVTRHIGLVPVATVTHTEPFHVSKAIATLDFVSHGRAGWQVRVSGTEHEAQLFGRRDIRDVDLFAEVRDAVEVVRRLWDSWEDDAVIRDIASDACDGFILVPHLTRRGLDEFVEKVVPLLQERAGFRTAYTGHTLRDHLGL